MAEQQKDAAGHEPLQGAPELAGDVLDDTTDTSVREVAEAAARETAETEPPEVEPPAQTDDTEPDQKPAASGGGFPDRIRRLFAAWWANPLKRYIGLVVLLVVLLALLPFSRNQALGLVLHERVSVVVTDSKMHTPVSGADVTVGSQKAKTDASGKVSLEVKYGAADLGVQKQYYKNYSEAAFVSFDSNAFKVSLDATGRQVPVTVINKITGQPVSGADIKVVNTQAKTDKNGKATIVLPTGQAQLTGTATADNYNQANITVQVTNGVVPTNTFSLTPSGKIYFLSNQSGKIDVVKTNLDGTNRQTVLAGTGNEEPYSTSLLASRDWKYLVLLSKRTPSGNAVLNLINTTTGDITNFDSGNATFDPIGWDNDYFVYIVHRNGYKDWQSGATSLKSYDAKAGKMYTLDNTKATGSSEADAQYENLFPYDVQLVGNDILFSKTWYQTPGYLTVPGQQNTLTVINADGSGKKTVATLDAGKEYVGSTYQNSPQEVLIQVSQLDNSPSSYYKYTVDGSYAKDTDQGDIAALNNSFSTAYPTYLLSPSGNASFWTDVRDGKNTLFVGDDNASGGKQIATLSNYAAYGWYTDNYLLVSKGSSELYIMPKNGGTPLKITDYYKPTLSYHGYGGGYGGL